MLATKTLRLRSGKDRPIRLGHPWVFAGAIADLDPSLPAGTLVRLESAGREFLGIGAANPRCAIAVRILTREEEAVDAAFVHRRVREALRMRAVLMEPDTTVLRCINGEGDALPGVIVDRYEDVLVLQCLTAGAAALQPLVVDALIDLLKPRCIFERSAGSVRREEGLPNAEELLHGDLPDPLIVVREHGHRFVVDVYRGQKTGFYIDQRDNRLLASRLADSRRVLNAFAYTGGFAVYSAAGGAREVVSVESSARAIELARENWRLNELPAERGVFIEADVSRFLRASRSPDDAYDLIILDPPAFVRHRKDAARGARAYKDLHLQAFRRAAAGALILTCSCSVHVGPELFRKIIAGAAADARREILVLRQLGAGADHPTPVALIEGEYLTGLLLHVR